MPPHASSPRPLPAGRFRHACRILSVLGLLLGLAGCGNSIEEDVVQYHRSMDPLMARNTTIARQFLDLTAEFYKEDPNYDEVTTRIQKEIVPAADALASDISAIQPTAPEIREIHENAVTAWRLQAEGYRQATQAFSGNDPAAFNEAYRKIGQAKVLAESYIREINALISDYGYTLDEFPEPM